MIGRAFLYGLAAMGEEGVERSLDIIARELDTTMALCGYTDIEAVDAKILSPRFQHANWGPVHQGVYSRRLAVTDRVATNGRTRPPLRRSGIPPSDRVGCAP